ncbi:COMM domain-containing protein 3 [Bradysia coprophila]|uniref:COMM domain-containing protein 3 n=1 Tax=Bradysia coprophila TaxID=38358 RepID=UPI00187D8345|nr:COMM domain-containing protein 3 [Bradysia coprophila]
MDHIELSSIVVDGLKCLNTSINTDLTKKLISNAVKMALYSDANIPANPEIYATKPDFAKQAEYAVLTVIFLSIKHNYDSTKFRSLLESHNVSAMAVDELIKVYDTNKTELRVKNLTTGISLPHMTNVEWKLTCDVKSSQTECGSGELTYNIHLGRYKDKTGERETIADFVCNVEELQSLIYKLKEIERQYERLSEK